jgi:hypothetical protein
MHSSMSEAGKAAAKLKDNTSWTPFLGELGILTLLLKVGNHVPHCLMKFRGRCQYVLRRPRAESDRDDP